jgi:hypothetical protein
VDDNLNSRMSGANQHVSYQQSLALGLWCWNFCDQLGRRNDDLFRLFVDKLAPNNCAANDALAIRRHTRHVLLDLAVKVGGEHSLPAVLEVVAHQAPEAAAQLGKLGLHRADVAIERLARLKAASVRDKDAALGVALTRLGLLLALILQPLLFELQLEGDLLLGQAGLLRLAKLAFLLNATFGRFALNTVFPPGRRPVHT